MDYKMQLDCVTDYPCWSFEPARRWGRYKYRKNNTKKEYPATHVDRVNNYMYSVFSRLRQCGRV